MKTKNEQRCGGGAKASKKLMAAIALMAIAFAILAAIPAIADDGSEAATATYDVTREIGKDETVEIQEDWTIGSGQTITVAGKLIVPEGKTLTVAASGNADGTGAGHITLNGGNVIIYGTASIAGDCYINEVDGKGSLIAGSGSTVTVAKTGKVVTYYSNNAVKVMKSATLKIEGVFTSELSKELIIANYGNVEIDSDVPATDDIQIRPMIDNATVTVKKFTAGLKADQGWPKVCSSLSIWDTADIYSEDGGLLGSVVDGGELGDNLISLYAGTDNYGDNCTTTIKGPLVFTEKVLKESSGDTGATGYYDGHIYGKRIMVSGGVSASFNDNNLTLLFDVQGKQGVEIQKEGLTVGNNIVFNNNGYVGSKVLVEGTLDASSDNAKTSNSTSNAIITVSGDGCILTKNEIGPTINAVASKNEDIYTYVAPGKDLTGYGVVHEVEAVAGCSWTYQTEFTIESGVEVTFEVNEMGNIATIDGHDLKITYIPANMAGNSYNIVLKANHAESVQTIYQWIRITVNQPLSVYYEPKVDKIVAGNSVDFNLMHTGGTGEITWFVDGGMPDGMQLEGSKVTGTPTAIGKNTITLRAYASSYGASEQLTIEFTVVEDTLRIKGGDEKVLTYEDNEKNETVKLTATGTASKITWSIPETAGISISDEGVLTITGSATVTTDGKIIVTATSASGQTATKTISYVVEDTLSIAGETKLVGVVGKTASTIYTITGGSANDVAISDDINGTLTFEKNTLSVKSSSAYASTTVTLTVTSAAGQTATINVEVVVYATLEFTSDPTSDGVLAYVSG